MDFDDVLTRLRYMKHQAEEVYALRSVHPHYIEMDGAINMLTSSIRNVERAKDVYNAVVKTDVAMRSP